MRTARSSSAATPRTRPGSCSGHAVVTTPYGASTTLVRSFEWSRLESGVVSVKFYAQGVGIVSEKDVAGGHESFELVSVRRP